MKKLLSISLCLAMVLALAASAFAAISLGPIGDGGFPMPSIDKPTAPNMPDVCKEWADLIDSIGEVDLDDGEKIAQAEEMWNNNWGLKDGFEQIYKNPDDYPIVEEYRQTMENARKAYDAKIAAQPTEPATTTLTIGEKTIEVLKSQVAIDKADASTNEYAFIVYTPAYTGEGVTNGYGEAIVVDKDGKIVRVYDGVSGKFFDATHAGVTGAGCTPAGYAAEAFASRQEGETVIIAPNGTVANAVKHDHGNAGTRYYLYSNRTVGAQVSGLGLTFGEPTVEPTVPTEPSTPATEPSTPATEPSETTPSTPSTPVDPNGDGTFMVVALAVLSMTALVVLVSKKRAF